MGTYVFNDGINAPFVVRVLNETHQEVVKFSTGLRLLDAHMDNQADKGAQIIVRNLELASLADGKVLADGHNRVDVVDKVSQKTRLHAVRKRLVERGHIRLEVVEVQSEGFHADHVEHRLLNMCLDINHRTGVPDFPAEDAAELLSLCLDAMERLSDVGMREVASHGSAAHLVDDAFDEREAISDDLVGKRAGESGLRKVLGLCLKNFLV